jgi:hypothetical protein
MAKQVQISEFSASVSDPVSNRFGNVLQVQDEEGLASSQKIMIAGK